ncbi:MAG: ABA4-like family protein [Bryobacteraceae bacterium]
MTPEMLFGICNQFALLGWLVLIVAGRKRWASSLVTGVWVPLVLGLVYAVLIPLHWGESEGSLRTLAGVAGLFAHRWLLLAGWIHYLAFDLFVGSWEVRDARRNRISHWAVIPCLVLTFLFGPVGLLSYFGLRIAMRRKLAIEWTWADKGKITATR